MALPPSEYLDVPCPLCRHSGTWKQEGTTVLFLCGTCPAMLTPAEFAGVVSEVVLVERSNHDRWQKMIGALGVG
jgi:hypothetical protein